MYLKKSVRGFTDTITVMAGIEINGMDDCMDGTSRSILVFKEILIKEHTELLLQVLSKLFTSCGNVSVKRTS